MAVGGFIGDPSGNPTTILIKGKWMFNNIVDMSAWNLYQYELINFISNGEEYVGFAYSDNDSLVYVENYDPDSPFVPQWDGTHVYLYNDTWVNEECRTVDFGATEQEVTIDFFTWLTLNAVEVTESDDSEQPLTIADKLLITAENEPRVYEAGKIAVIKGTVQDTRSAQIDSSCLLHDKLKKVADRTLQVYEAGQKSAEDLKATVSGSVIRVDNVNPIEHNLKVNCRKIICEGETVALELGGTALTNFPLLSGQANFSFDVAAGKVFKAGLLLDGFSWYADATLQKNENHYTGFVEVPSDGENYCLALLPDQEEVNIANLTISSNENITVSRFGKNLMTELKMYPQKNNDFLLPQPFYMKKGETYTFSFETTYTQWRLMLYGTTTDGLPLEDINYHYVDGMYTANDSHGSRLQTGSNISSNRYRLVCNNDFIVTGVLLWNSANETDKIYSNAQLEYGNINTAYEPYIEPQTATSTADGTVEGLTSISPSMTLITDNEGVVINLTYNANTK